MPRRVRRTLGVSAAVAMAAAAAVIVGWVARGALSTPVTPAALVTPAATPTRTPTPTPSASTAPRPAPTTPGRPQAFTRTGNLFTLNTDLTFESGSATLNAPAKAGLARIIAQVKKEHRTGTITVDGFTDSDGTAADNMTLSLARAEAVADVLRRGLRGRGITVVAEGFGEEREKASNATEAGKAVNRRVEITVPGTPG